MDFLPVLGLVEKFKRLGFVHSQRRQVMRREGLSFFPSSISSFWRQLRVLLGDFLKRDHGRVVGSCRCLCLSCCVRTLWRTKMYFSRGCLLRDVLSLEGLIILLHCSLLECLCKMSSCSNVKHAALFKALLIWQRIGARCFVLTLGKTLWISAWVLKVCSSGPQISVAFHSSK